MIHVWFIIRTLFKCPTVYCQEMNFIKTAILLLFICLVFCNGDVPCNKVKTEYGYICVCNSTYCDTISSPKKLPAGQFHIYYTSENKPGFNHATGFFKMQSPSAHGYRYELNTSKTFQTVRGFGGAFTDSFGAVFNSLSTEAQDNMLKSLFSEDGIEYTVCRVVIGSSDFSLRSYNYVPNYDPSLKSFNLTEDDYLYKIGTIKRALNISKRKIHLFGSAWTTPSWMKINNSTKNGYLNPKFRQVWANYLVKSLDAFKKEGIEFWGLTTGNEPITLILLDCDTLIMFPEEQREWIINNLGPALRNANYSTKIITLDDMRSFAVWWAKVLMRDPRAKEFVFGFGLHWYLDRQTSTEFLDNLYRRFPEQEVVYTESSINVLMNKNEIESITTDSNKFDDLSQPSRTAPHLGSWPRAELYVVNALENLNHYVTSYTDWNIALDLEGGPNLGNFPCDASIIVNKTADEFYKQPIHYVLGHFSKFILPGSVVFDLHSNKDVGFSLDSYAAKIDTSSTTGAPHHPTLPPPSENIQHIAAKNIDGSQAIIFYNPKSMFAEVSFHDPSRGYAFINLEPKSISTVIYW
ncbi:putative glucosylceramidase 4 [Lycorma delicatula]|uniref:putative glucosylceramidase 4 n=1 Tax=Lycorma delicatula TaxID=130591 RepID=UPI003F513D56